MDDVLYISLFNSGRKKKPISQKIVTDAWLTDTFVEIEGYTKYDIIIVRSKSVNRYTLRESHLKF